MTGQEEIMAEELKVLRKREVVCARTLKGRALLVIDHLISNIEPDDPFIGKIYRIAHCATGVCGNPHEDWVKEVDETYKALKVANT